MLVLLLAPAAWAVMPNDPLLQYDANRRLPYAEAPGAYTRNEWGWWAQNGGQTSHLYDASGALQNKDESGTDDIRAAAAWDLCHDATNVVIGFIDTGVNDHEDLRANLVPGVAYNGDTPSTNTAESFGRDLGHGTRTASVIAAVGNNGLGTAGVCWRARLMPLKTANWGFMEIAHLIDYAVSNRVKVINLDWGTTEHDPRLHAAFERARAAGVIIVAAALNAPTDQDATPDYPAAWRLDNVVAVNSVDRRGNPFWSGYGTNTIHLAAPGRLIPVAEYAATNAYRFVSGTSIAAPFVTGALALILERFPGESYRRTIERLLASADRLPQLAGKNQTGGRLNLYRALQPEGALPR